MTDLNNPGEVLRAAADVIRERGLHKGGLIPAETTADPEARKTCPVCAWGAIRAVVFGGDPLPPVENGEDIPAELCFTNFLTRTAGQGQLVPSTSWNDAPERTQEEVIAALEEAAGTCPAPS